MPSRFAPTGRTQLIRALLGLGAAALVTVLIFQFMAAFNGVMKVINQITTEMALQCPEGYDLVAADDGSATCRLKPPPPPPGVVPVTIYAAPPPKAPPPKTQPVTAAPVKAAPPAPSKDAPKAP